MPGKSHLQRSLEELQFTEVWDLDMPTGLNTPRQSKGLIRAVGLPCWLYRGRLLLNTGSQETGRTGHRLEDASVFIPSSPPAQGNLLLVFIFPDGGGRVVPGLGLLIRLLVCITSLFQFAFKSNLKWQNTALKAPTWLMNKIPNMVRRQPTTVNGEDGCDSSLLFWANQGMDP